MKSFHKIVPADQAQAFAAWKFDDLDVPENRSRTVEIEAIMEAFRAPVKPESRPTGDSSSRALAWLPEEFSDEPVVFEPPAFDFPDDDELEMDEPELHQHRNLQIDAQREAENILQTARAQATEIMLQAQRTVDEMIADARKEIDAGGEAAYRQGIETAQNETAAALQAAHAIIEETGVWKESLIDQSVPLIIDMVTQIARKMFGEGVALSDHALQQNLNRVLTTGKSLGDLNIYLNPQDAGELDSGWREMRSITTGSRVRILPADDIKRGGCYIQGQMGAIDARVETQLKTVLDALAAAPSDEESGQ